MRRRLTRDEAILAGGVAVALAATADTAWSLRARFALDLEGLSALERAGVALWDFRPLAVALFAGAALAVLFTGGAPTRAAVAVLAGAHAALAVVVLALAVWIAAAGGVGDRDELGFSYSTGERTVTLATQLLAWLPLAVLLAGVAVVATRTPGNAVVLGGEAPAPSTPPAEPASLSEEMEALWADRLAFGPRRERARSLLERIRALEERGDGEAARELAEEMRRL